MRPLKRYEEFEDETGHLVRYRRLDGGGVVAVGADVAEDAQVGADAWIDPRARILAGARVGGRCWVEPGAVVGEQAHLGADVHVGRDVVVGAGAWVGDRTDIGARARVGQDVVLEPDTRVAEDESILTTRRRAVAARSTRDLAA